MAEKDEKSKEVDTKDIIEQPDAGVGDYEPPTVEMTEEDIQRLQLMVRTSDQAQIMFLEGRITENELAKAVRMYGKPSNPSETFNRVDAAYETKLPTWCFHEPYGAEYTEVSLEERQKLADAKNTYDPDAPMTLEYRALWPEQAREWDEKHAKKEDKEQKETPKLTSGKN